MPAQAEARAIAREEVTRRRRMGIALHEEARDVTLDALQKKARCPQSGIATSVTDSITGLSFASTILSHGKYPWASTLIR